MSPDLCYYLKRSAIHIGSAVLQRRFYREALEGLSSDISDLLHTFWNSSVNFSSSPLFMVPSISRPTAVELSNTAPPVAPAAMIPFTAMPPIAALWHHANRLPASTAPIDACHAAADEPATGPNTPNPAAPRIGRVTVAAIPTRVPTH